MSFSPLSFRGASYSGVFTLFPMLAGLRHAHHGSILNQAAALAEQAQLKPLLANVDYGENDIEAAYKSVAQGITGKVVVQL